jgi:replicative DNA helicase
MKWSAPIYHLKRKARLLSREKKIPLHEALDQIAIEEGFRRWSSLSACAAATTTATKLFAQLRPADVALIGARPGHGKTLMGIEILVRAMKAGHRAAFFTLESTEKDVNDLFQAVGADMTQFGDRFHLDTSDDISAELIIKQLTAAAAGTTVVVDYLQLLDQQRHKPVLADQVQMLKAFAREKGVVIIFLSQIDRSFDSANKLCPGLEDLRLPNPLDVALFTKTCFVHDGTAQLRSAG